MHLIDDLRAQDCKVVWGAPRIPERRRTKRGTRGMRRRRTVALSRQRTRESRKRLTPLRFPRRPSQSWKKISCLRRRKMRLGFGFRARPAFPKHQRSTRCAWEPTSRRLGERPRGRGPAPPSSRAFSRRGGRLMRPREARGAKARSRPRHQSPSSTLTLPSSTSQSH